MKEVHKKEVGKSSRREKSLLEIHQSKVAKKKKVTIFLLALVTNFLLAH